MRKSNNGTSSKQPKRTDYLQNVDSKRVNKQIDSQQDKDYDDDNDNESDADEVIPTDSDDSASANAGSSEENSLSNESDQETKEERNSKKQNDKKEKQKGKDKEQEVDRKRKSQNDRKEGSRTEKGKDLTKAAGADNGNNNKESLLVKLRRREQQEEQMRMNLALQEQKTKNKNINQINIEMNQSNKRQIQGQQQLSKKVQEVDDRIEETDGSQKDKDIQDEEQGQEQDGIQDQEDEDIHNYEEEEEEEEEDQQDIDDEDEEVEEQEIDDEDDQDQGNHEEFSSSSDSDEPKQSNVINTEDEDIEMQLTKKKITKSTMKKPKPQDNTTNSNNRQKIRKVIQFDDGIDDEDEEQGNIHHQKEDDEDEDEEIYEERNKRQIEERQLQAEDIAQRKKIKKQNKKVKQSTKLKDQEDKDDEEDEDEEEEGVDDDSDSDEDEDDDDLGEYEFDGRSKSRRETYDIQQTCQKWIFFFLITIFISCLAAFILNFSQNRTYTSPPKSNHSVSNDNGNTNENKEIDLYPKKIFPFNNYTSMHTEYRQQFDIKRRIKQAQCDNDQPIYTFNFPDKQIYSFLELTCTQCNSIVNKIAVIPSSDDTNESPESISKTMHYQGISHDIFSPYRCPAHSVFIDGTCIQCNQNCHQCSQFTQNCYSCYSDKQYLLDHSCFETCPQQEEGYIVHGDFCVAKVEQSENIFNDEQQSRIIQIHGKNDNLFILSLPAVANNSQKLPFIVMLNSQDFTQQEFLQTQAFQKYVDQAYILSFPFFSELYEYKPLHALIIQEIQDIIIQFKDKDTKLDGNTIAFFGIIGIDIAGYQASGISLNQQDNQINWQMRFQISVGITDTNQVTILSQDNRSFEESIKIKDTYFQVCREY